MLPLPYSTLPSATNTKWAITSLGWVPLVPYYLKKNSSLVVWLLNKEWPEIYMAHSQWPRININVWLQWGVNCLIRWQKNVFLILPIQKFPSNFWLCVVAVSVCVCHMIARISLKPKQQTDRASRQLCLVELFYTYSFQMFTCTWCIGKLHNVKLNKYVCTLSFVYITPTLFRFIQYESAKY